MDGSIRRIARGLIAGGMILVGVGAFGCGVATAPGNGEVAPGANPSSDPATPTRPVGTSDPEVPEVLVPGPVPYPRACADLHQDDAFPTFEVEISETDWARIQEEFLTGAENYYPITFRMGGEAVPDAMMRLRGNHSRCGTKLQFAISFNQINEKGRFHGLRRINLDHGGCNLMGERLALSLMRDLGLPAACANHARLLVNGEYYGLFLNIEHVNKDFLQRHFAEDDGNLYKSGWRLRTNEAEADTSDLEAYRAAQDVASISQLVDLEEAITEWAAEAVLPARDNYLFNGWNYYLYSHPTRGFLFIPTDLDQAFPAGVSDADADTILLDGFQEPARTVLADPVWREKYLAQVETTIGALDLTRLEQRLDRWWAQVAVAAAEDPHHPFEEGEVTDLKERVRARRLWLEGWLDGR